MSHENVERTEYVIALEREVAALRAKVELYERNQRKPANNHKVLMEAALDIINDQLGIQAAQTVKGDEVKCYVPDPENGGVCKAYFDSRNCFELAECFEFLGTALRVIAQ